MCVFVLICVSNVLVSVPNFPFVFCVFDFEIRKLGIVASLICDIEYLYKIHSFFQID